MDPLSDFLNLLKPRTYSCGGFDAGGKWSVKFPKYPGIKCYSVVSGQCWLESEGSPEAVLLSAGDCFLLPTEHSFRISSDLSVPSIDFKSIATGTLSGGTITYNGGGDCYIVGGHFTLPDLHAEHLTGMLPPVVHIRSDIDRVGLRWALDSMRKELSEPKPGGHLLIQHLVQMMLIQALRLYSEQAHKPQGWLFALSDSQLSAAITAMHANPSSDWTVQRLAHLAGMSRSVFAARFKKVVGEPPMEYLTRWRMMLATERLLAANESVSEIAISLGYESESAFGKAFKKVMGFSPRQYCKEVSRENR